MRFAFYGRVSTEDQQDPAASRGWQISRAEALIAPHGGKIVAEFFDIGQSRSLPWKRRPESAALLMAMTDPKRRFDAVVVGEPARAFYGQQFGLTFPVFVHYGVELWVPEVGGRVDPGSDAHDMVMNLYGGMSKGERNRIKIRVRSAMSDQAHREGRFLGGRPPYGYRLADVGAHPNPSKAADGKRQHQLELDPVAAPVVRRIFTEYIEGLGLYAIAEGLTRDGIPSPSGHDPDRNRHRAATRGAWGKTSVKVVLGNPRYTGRQVWNRQRRDEVLLDVEDVALGHETKMRWNDPSDWVWSTEQAHEPIIDAETFAAAQRIRAASAHRPTEAKQHRTGRRYLLSGLVTCGICQRRMQGQPNHGGTYYRCRYPSEYAMTKEVNHPKTVYVQEDPIVAALDRWLGRLFDAAHIDETCRVLAGVSEVDEEGAARAEGARRQLADCDARLAKYRAALEAGADPTIVAGWLREVEGQRLTAERALSATGSTAPLTAAQVKALVGDARRVVRKLANADSDLKAELYQALGVRATYLPESNSVELVAQPVACATERVGGAYWPTGACRRAWRNPTRRLRRQPYERQLNGWPIQTGGAFKKVCLGLGAPAPNLKRSARYTTAIAADRSLDPSYGG
ncbi:MAG: recombinase family protein [Acidimicrobiales bacterium]